MSARIFGRYGETRGIDLRIGDRATIGRDPSNEVCVSASEVSKEHATLLYDRDRGGYVLTDLGSRNGTLLDGAPVRGPELLQGLHVITLAESIDLIFHGGAPEPAQEAARAPAPPSAARPPTPTPAPPSAAEERPAARPAPPARPTPEAVPPQRYVLVVETPGADQGTYPLAEGENGVGRGADLAVKLTAGEVSRSHAVIAVREGVALVRDDGSANGTFLNGGPVSGETRVEEGDLLCFGSTEARLRRVDSD